MDEKKIHQNPSDVKFPTLWLLAARKLNAEECEYIIERNKCSEQSIKLCLRGKMEFKIFVGISPCCIKFL